MSSTVTTATAASCCCGTTTPGPTSKLRKHKTHSSTYNTSGADRSTWRPSRTTSRCCGPSTGVNQLANPSEIRMTLDEPLLARLADWRPAGVGPHTFQNALTSPAWTLALTADRAE